MVYAWVLARAAALSAIRSRSVRAIRPFVPCSSSCTSVMTSVFTPSLRLHIRYTASPSCSGSPLAACGGRRRGLGSTTVPRAKGDGGSEATRPAPLMDEGATTTPQRAETARAACVRAATPGSYSTV